MAYMNLAKSRVWAPWCLTFAWLLAGAAAQGLVPSKPRLGADSTYKSAYDRFRQQWQGSRSWQSAFKSAPQRACSRGGASTTLCSSAAGAAAADDKFAQLLLATSPARFFSVPIYAFAALNGWKLQDYYARQNPVLLAPGNQGSCQTCTAFTVAAAAEAAVAATLDRSAQEVGRLSVQDLAFCSEAGLRPCSSGWTLEGALSRLKDGRPLKLDQCLKYRPDLRGDQSQASVCKATCNTTSQLASMGSFSYRVIPNMWEAQRQIRRFGVVISRFDIMSDFRGFFSNRANRNAVYRPSPNATLVEPHAILLIGYDNEGQYWRARNSWGPSFADEGSFNVAYGVAGVLSPEDSYGLEWQPKPGVPVPQLPLTASLKFPACKVYKPASQEYMSRVAWRAGVPLERLLLDNLDKIKEPDENLQGKEILVCPDSAPPTSALASPSASAQLDALLAIKDAVDKKGAALRSWDPAKGAGGAFCRAFLGVKCDVAGDVVAIGLRGLALGGALPSGALLGELPKLITLDCTNAGLTGPVPIDYGSLAAIKELRLGGNSLSGTLPSELSGMASVEVLNLAGGNLAAALPDSWGALTKLKALNLSGNALTGTLPASFGGLGSLQSLDLHSNQVGGQLPAAWAGLAASLRALNLDSNTLDGSLPKEWGALASLATLNLAANQLQGPLPPEWSGLAKLTALNLGFNQLTGSVPDAWAKLSSLKDLNLAYNKLGGALGPALSAKLSALPNLILVGNAFKAPAPKDRSSRAPGGAAVAAAGPAYIPANIVKDWKACPVKSPKSWDPAVFVPNLDTMSVLAQFSNLQGSCSIVPSLNTCVLPDSPAADDFGPLPAAASSAGGGDADGMTTLGTVDGCCKKECTDVLLQAIKYRCFDRLWVAFCTASRASSFRAGLLNAAKRCANYTPNLLC